MNILRNFSESVFGGIFLTVVSGLINSTPVQLLGASWYGWPFTWVRYLVIAPQYNPWVVDWTGFVIDFVFWFLVSYVVLFLVKNATGTQKTATKKAKKSGR